jgi:hypothetical protein
MCTRQRREGVPTPAWTEEGLHCCAVATSRFVASTATGSSAAADFLPRFAYSHPYCADSDPWCAQFVSCCANIDRAATTTSKDQDGATYPQILHPFMETSKAQIHGTLDFDLCK